MDHVPPSQNVDLLVPRELVKEVKTALEQSAQFDRARRIQPCQTVQNYHVVPTTFEETAAGSAWLKENFKLDSIVDIEVLGRKHDDKKASKSTGPPTSVLRDVIRTWLDTLTPALSSTRIDELIKDVPTGYSIYHPMLLLPPNTFTSSNWQRLLHSIPANQVSALWTSLTTAFSVTHVAINAPIPLSTTTAAITNTAATEENDGNSNILRSPSGLRPLYGDFGPNLTNSASSSSSSDADYNAAFWVSARQNGITQVWAPRYTMFSRGNIKEKARLLNLQSVRDAVSPTGGAASLGDETKRQRRIGCTAVDMYAGIGYFAFSYVKAGVDLVIGFEMNGWSVEGLRRGAMQNGWPVSVLHEQHDTSWLNSASETPKLVVYQMDNGHATDVVRRIRREVPPIRHVNLGLLPSSRASWAAAVDMVDAELGGWVHVHENFRIDDISALADDVRKQFQRLYDAKFAVSNMIGQLVILEHVEKVKTYAPGVMHCVLDIYLPGQQPTS